jgi:peptidoglycan/LPS O-acetylase OafA/YrhL
MNFDCGKGIGALYAVLYLLVIIMAGTVIQTGKSDDKKVSWALYSFALIFGLACVMLLFFLKCDSNGKSRASVFKYVIPILTGIATISNMVAMIIAKPDLKIGQLFTPHFANVGLFGASIVAGLSVCAQCSSGALSEDSE